MKDSRWVFLLLVGYLAGMMFFAPYFLVLGTAALILGFVIVPILWIMVVILLAKLEGQESTK